jgi:small subunit ribosomal protein S17
MKIFTGKVVSNKMPKTVTVEVERLLSHPVYKKRFKRTRKYQVHSENVIKIGETVKFVNTRPISKTKKWKILDVETSVKSEIKNSKSETSSNTKIVKPKTNRKGAKK